MNRVIKFRKWHKELQDMTFWDGTPGSNNLFWHTLTEYPSMYNLMQFTGLKDKNGIEIYEGDIVKCIDHPTEIESCTGEVVFDVGRYYVQGRHMMLSVDEYGADWTEVIGNIYENPELL